MEDYLQPQLTALYAVAQQARQQGWDPSLDVEVKIAPDVAARVENIVGPPGIAAVIREKEKENMSREDIAFELARRITQGEWGTDKVKNIEQAIRTAVGLLTEGILVAPTEGISGIAIKENADGSDYLAVYYTGPIRSAGGTAMALSVMIADVVRRIAKVGDYRPTATQIERYVEEVNIYEARISHLQYKPPDEDVRFIVSRCPVAIFGDPTEDVEVSAYRDVPGIETNRIRGGVPLVLCEGIAQKAGKLLKYSKKLALGWEWLENVVKISRSEKTVLEPQDGYLEGLVAGRPVFAYPSRPGGFRLRYGRDRGNGLMAKCIHPATMSIVEGFLATGTHMKIERPGKGCVMSPNSTLEPPVVKLRDGSVVRLQTMAQAEKVRSEIAEILFLGDLLVTYGDFLKSNHPLLPSGICEEWWMQEVEKKGVVVPATLTVQEAFALSRQHDIPLHPRYTFFWHDISLPELRRLIDGLKEGISSETKEVLEKLLVEHRVKEGEVILEKEVYETLRASLGLERWAVAEAKERIKDAKDSLDAVNILSGARILAKAPTYIGARMGRPEKAKERKMEGSPNVLFPTGSQKNRSLTRLYRLWKNREQEQMLRTELARLRCSDCNGLTFYPRCHHCGGKTMPERICVQCQRVVNTEVHCERPTVFFDSRPLNISSLFSQLKEKWGFAQEEIRGVKGLSNAKRMPERLEKGFLRAKHDVYVFRDGTARFDATNAPLTHFRPCEIGVSLEKLGSLGYTHDCRGEELRNEKQLLALKSQDVILSERGGEYFLRVSMFIDELLLNGHGIKPFYNCHAPEDLVGHLIASLSPHTSAAVLGRIIGFTKAYVAYNHPYPMAARRRNADGDEDSYMLLLDALLNFSMTYLDEKRGGKMDAPLVLTPFIDPKEVDDEVHAIERVSHYPLEFYYATLEYKAPSEIKLRTVRDTLGTPEQFEPFPLTHATSDIHEGNMRTAYVGLKSIPEKLDAQFALQDRLRAVDSKDAAERLIANHFIPDLYGNLRSFSRQTFRCSQCNASHRRPPLHGKCVRCGGKLLLTINKGGIQKYLEVSKNIVQRYALSEYTKQLLDLVEREIKSIFEDDEEKQTGLADFV